MIVADTDVLIDFLRGAKPYADRVEVELKSRGLSTTSITAFELRSGARSKRQEAAVSSLLDAMTILPFGAEEAKVAADIRLRLEADGLKIGMADYMIASVCLCRRSILFTRNVKHFERVPGLSLSA